MGSNTSKPSAESAGSILNGELDTATNCDPRSPNPEIVRTPLQGKTGSKHNITKNVDLRKTFEGAKGEEKLIHNNPILSAVIKNHLQSYDPRSPTQDFERTPIVIGVKDEEEPSEKNLMRQLNENDFGSPSLANDYEDTDLITDNIISDMVVPKNLCDGFFDMTLDDTIKQPETPLGQSTASNESIEKDNLTESIGKQTQFLETNFDYVETDIDNFHDSEEVLDDNGKHEAHPKVIPLFKILENDPRSPSTGIERTPIVVANMNDSDDNVEEMSDDTLIKVLQSTNSELRQTKSKNAEGLLIYEDETVNNLNDTPKKSKSAGNSGSRTPLSCMKNKADTGHIRSKSANTLSDPKNGSAKIPKRASHIPRLKALSKQTIVVPNSNNVSLKNMSKAAVISGDCENTPPHSHRDRWDKDCSIVL